MTGAPLNFAKRAAIGSEEANLRKAMAAARQGLFKKSKLAMSHPGYQDWKERGTYIRDHALANLDVLLERFEDNATKAGAQVHWASDAARARAIVARIASENNCKTAIKSKSMLTEEIRLNEGLAKQGVEVLETDLGEYVVQLSKGVPSHIIAPIIHMTKDQVARLFAEHHEGKKPVSDKEGLVAQAREVLRPRMLAADMGITGANFLSAATGSTVMVTNEGNGRFCAGLPRIRVTVAGIEKMVPTLGDVAWLLRLLPRAATGQMTSTYVTVTTGTRQTPSTEQHHIVLVDNGRSRMLAGKYRKMLRCIRCGSCMNNCPVYRTVGGLSYGSVYPGPMGAVLSPNLFGAGHDDLPHAATMCGACDANCPVRIPLTSLMRNLREDQVSSGKESLLQRLMFAAWAFAAKRPPLYAAGSAVASFVLRKAAGRRGVLDGLPGCGQWFGTRDLRVPASAPYRFDKQEQDRQ